MPQAQFHLHLHNAANLMLTQAILVYRACGGGTETAYASVHEVTVHGVRATIQAGKPVTPRAALHLAHAIAPRTAHVGYLPGNVLYADGDTLVWWNPPQLRHIAFRCADSMLGERSAVVAHPALVFMVSGTKWLVWAHKGRNRPLPDSPMWQAPYFNVGADGTICRGNVATPGGSTTDKIDAWEDAFFRSYFTHPNRPKGLVRHAGGAYAFWLQMIEQQVRRFPLRALVATGTTLAELVALHSR
jgi:PRTRC genetic system protein B